ncbi:MAG: tyrosine-type recombinase/integrase [Deltaproteobacteria bacterium]|nr:tyrosine-type recombinase/integrase [Deltaproteobacteria bacterium]
MSDMRLSGENLPRIAKQFLKSKEGVWTWSTIERTASPINQFHHWLSKNGIELKEITERDLQKFMEDCRQRNLKRESFRVLSSGVCHYLEWLKNRRVIRVKLEDVYPQSSLCAKPLPPSAQQFLNAMSITLSSSTLLYYTTCIRGLHSFLRKRAGSLKSMTRRDSERFMISLFDQGLSPASRVQWLISVRVYFRWLNEHNLLDQDADRLIRVTDFPRVPEYLPRPLPAEIDREIQVRLSRSEGVYERGLLLMRLTGIRVSELLALKFECLKKDFDGNAFLKVELGKLKNERLVPIDSRTVVLIETLQEEAKKIVGQLHSQQQPDFLINDPFGRQAATHRLREALAEICIGIKTKEPITTHRMRHTFATQLLGAGVSIFSLMKILGHRHFKMTLRYAAITQETIRKEYNSAIEKIDKELDLLQTNPEIRNELSNPQEVLPDLVRWLRQGGPADQRQKLLIRKIQKLERELRGSFSKSEVKTAG